eukprot:4726485-Amphidinium_carterae.1
MSVWDPSLYKRDLSLLKHLSLQGLCLYNPIPYPGRRHSQKVLSMGVLSLQALANFLHPNRGPLPLEGFMSKQSGE